MDESVVSIIMPAYNAGIYIEESIQSVINQTFNNWELIVTDDGSTDNTAGIVKTFANTDERIKYFYQQNGKQGEARNLGLENSKGEFIAFLDADDKWTPDKLAIQVNILLANEDIDLVFSQGYALTGSNVEDFNVKVKNLWDYTHLPDFIQSNQIPILSVLARREPLISANLFITDEKIQNTEDYHLWLKLLITNSRFRSIPDRLFYYRIHNNQATFQNSNTSTQCFNVYQDIYYWTSDAYVKKLLINKMKWFIYKKEFWPQCVSVFSFHIAKKGFKLIAYSLKNYMNKPTPMHQKVVFKLISVFA